MLMVCMFMDRGTASYQVVAVLLVITPGQGQGPLFIQTCQQWLCRRVTAAGLFRQQIGAQRLGCSKEKRAGKKGLDAGAREFTEMPFAKLPAIIPYVIITTHHSRASAMGCCSIRWRCAPASFRFWLRRVSFWGTAKASWDQEFIVAARHGLRNTETRGAPEARLLYSEVHSGGRGGLS